MLRMYNRKVGSLMHMLYECDKNNDMWNAVVLFLNKMLGTHLFCMLLLDFRYPLYFNCLLQLIVKPNCSSYFATVIIVYV